MNHDIGLERHLISKLTRIIQRFEHESTDLTTDDITSVWRAKTYLGYSTPVSIEEGTGAMVTENEELSR
jgi:hypothetical protein